MGDNLGLNGISGFVESFTAKFYCRICEASLKECMQWVELDRSNLRNKINYANDVTIADLKNIGMKELCVFHKLNNLHITIHVNVDSMHDLLQGVSFYVLNSLLQTFIFEKKLFYSKLINSEVQSLLMDGTLHGWHIAI